MSLDRQAWGVVTGALVALCILGQALADSLDYLLMLRDGARRLIAEGAFDPVEVAEKLDQSRFSYLRHYNDTRLRSENAIRMATEVFASAEKQ